MLKDVVAVIERLEEARVEMGNSVRKSSVQASRWQSLDWVEHSREPGGEMDVSWP